MTTRRAAVAWTITSLAWGLPAQGGTGQVGVGGGVSAALVEGRLRAGVHLGVDARWLRAEATEGDPLGVSVGASTLGASARAGWRFGVGPQISAGATAGVAWSAWLGPGGRGYRPDSETDLWVGAAWTGGRRVAPLVGLVGLHQVIRRDSCYGATAGPAWVVDTAVLWTSHAPEMQLNLSGARWMLPTAGDRSFYALHGWCMWV